jgi:hypothetical protein
MKTKEEQWKERREYDTWHSNYMEQLKNKILEEMNKDTELIAIDNELLDYLFEQEEEDVN